MYKYIHGMLPELFLNMFTSISDVHDYDTRQATKKKLSVPFKSTFRGQQSITYIGPHVWNFILSKINPICSIGSFKRHLRLLLQHCYVSDLKWWSLTFEKWNNKKKCSPNQYLHGRICCMCLSVCICMYACVWVYVNVYVCAHMRQHMLVYNTRYACVSVVSWCICAYDLLFLLFSLSLSGTNIVLHYDRYSAVPLWHGQFLSKSWQLTNHYLSVRARCGMSFVSSAPVLISANVVTNMISCHIGPRYSGTPL